MIKAKQVFFWTSNLKDHGFHGHKATTFYLTSKFQFETDEIFNVS